MEAFWLRRFQREIIDMNYINSTPAADGFRMPAEFERHQGCIMIWPERPGSWAYGAKAAKKAFAQIASVISESEQVYMIVSEGRKEEAAKRKQQRCSRKRSGL